MPSRDKYLRDISASRRIVLLTSLVFLALALWNAISSIRLHQNYQNTLMDSVTNSVLADYQERITNLRASIDTFQYQHDDDIAKLSS